MPFSELNYGQQNEDVDMVHDFLSLQVYFLCGESTNRPDDGTTLMIYDVALPPYTDTVDDGA